MAQALARHVHQNLPLYFLVGCAFVVGILLGAAVVLLLGKGQEVELAAHLDNLFRQIVVAEPVAGAVTARAALKGIKEIGFFWILGLTVIGSPLIVASVLVKGFVLGFTVAFLVQEKALEGIVLSLLSVMPGNIIRLPAILAGAVLALSFSWSLVKGNLGLKAGSFLGQLVAYSLAMAFLALVVMGSGWIEAYLVPPLARIALQYF
ncbi:stage II sporulation protein M [Thermanaeromonas sp. C210]|uniref:stage II sporulation protein M n=1 Tax=Thermanaeromonas sp. C210 TaxID=2731925 RepID=UPI00155C21B2|nr:stage II sporulation protein M [Thermanaeromonas sp. C210]GFN23339.1 stage II sporulation protein M [Thermanaeromonas sp. C210]